MRHRDLAQPSRGLKPLNNRSLASCARSVIGLLIPAPSGGFRFNLRAVHQVVLYVYDITFRFIEICTWNDTLEVCATVKCWLML